MNQVQHKEPVNIVERDNFYVTKGVHGVYFINRITILKTWCLWMGKILCYTADGQIIDAKYLTAGEDITQSKLELLSKRKLITLPKFIQDKIRKAKLLAYRNLTGRKHFILFPSTQQAHCHQ